MPNDSTLKTVNRWSGPHSGEREVNLALSVQGYPAFLTRKTNSIVNVHSGQTIVLSGLIHSTGNNTLNKLPWLGDIPILGALFRSTQFQHDQSELVIFVTPEVINPASPVNRAMVQQGRQDIARFNRDFQHGYFVPGIGTIPTRWGIRTSPPTFRRKRPARSR